MNAVKKFFLDLAHAYSWRFVSILFIVNFCCKGILYIVANNGMLPLFKAHGADAAQLQMFSALCMSPWAMKPLFGVLSDTIALGQYHKRYWMLIGCAFGIFGAFMLIVQLQLVSITVLFFFFIHMELAILDLLCEGKYAELMADHPESGSNIITFVNGCQNAGYIVALLFVGPLADAALFQPLFLIALIAAASPVAFISMGWVPEERRHINEPGTKGYLFWGATR
jgi:hypothetical protein